MGHPENGEVPATGGDGGREATVAEDVDVEETRIGG